MENIEEFTNELAKHLAALSLTLPDSALGAIYSHFATLEKWKHETNLISSSATFAEIVQNHYADSLAAMDLIKENCWNYTPFPQTKWRLWPAYSGK